MSVKVFIDSAYNTHNKKTYQLHGQQQSDSPSYTYDKCIIQIIITIIKKIKHMTMDKSVYQKAYTLRSQHLQTTLTVAQTKKFCLLKRFSAHFQLFVRFLMLLAFVIPCDTSLYCVYILAILQHYVIVKKDNHYKVSLVDMVF